MSDKANKAVLDQFNQVMGQFWQSGNADLFDQIMAADCAVHQPGFPPNLAGFKQVLPAFRSAFPDFKVLEFEAWEEGDKVADRVVWTATHKGELMGIPATGKTITVREVHIRRVASGKIVEHWGEWDQMGMMQQLGVIPS